MIRRFFILGGFAASLLGSTSTVLAEEFVPMDSERKEPEGLNYPKKNELGGFTFGDFPPPPDKLMREDLQVS
jgi:hypothetical protein